MKGVGRYSNRAGCKEHRLCGNDCQLVLTVYESVPSLFEIVVVYKGVMLLWIVYEGLFCSMGVGWIVIDLIPRQLKFPYCISSVWQAAGITLPLMGSVAWRNLHFSCLLHWPQLVDSLWSTCRHGPSDWNKAFLSLAIIRAVVWSWLTLPPHYESSTCNQV